MARRGKRFGPLLYVTLAGAGLALVAVPTWPRAVEQWTAWSLCRRLGDSDPKLRREAAEGLLQLGPAAAPWAIRAVRNPTDPARAEACSIVHRLDPDRLQAAIEALIVASDADQGVRQVAVQSLANVAFYLGPKGDPRLRGRLIAALRPAIGDRAIPIRVAAAHGLLQADPEGSRRLVVELMWAVTHDRAQERSSDHHLALLTLKEAIGADRLAAMLISSMAGSGSRQAILFELRQFCPDSKATEGAFVAALKDGNARVRCDAALFLLGRDPGLAAGALDLLIGMLADPPEGSYVSADLVRMIRAWSPDSLGRLVPALAGSLAGTRGRTFPTAPFEALGAIGPEAVPAVPALLAVAGSDDRTLATAALAALAKIDPTSTAPMIPRLIDRAASGEDAKARLAAIAVLRDLGTGAGAAVPSLVRMADEDDLRVSAAAIEALGAIDPPRAAAIKRAARD